MKDSVYGRLFGCVKESEIEREREREKERT